jgi:hypothetical protein
MGLDPTVAVEVGKVGLYHFEAGLRNRAAWFKRMIDDGGEKVYPYLADAWKEAQQKFTEGEGKRIVGRMQNRVAGGGTLRQLGGQIHQLAKTLVEGGITEREPLIDAVHGVLREIDPNITRREVMDAISGYGQWRPLSKDEIDVQLRDLKGQMQQVAKLEDMAAGQAPVKTGFERRTPSDAEKKLIQLVNRAKVMGGYKVTDPETQLRSALQAFKTRTANRITDLEERLAAGDYSVTPRARRLELDPEAQRLLTQKQMLLEKWQEGLFKDRLARRTLPEKALGLLFEVLNVPRLIMTSMDLSAVLRQGGFIGFGHPIRAVKAFPAMFKGLASEKGRVAVETEIKSRENYPLYLKSKLYLSEAGKGLAAMEEAYMGRWATKIPGVAASQRAYTTFLNRFRADSFDAMARSLGRTGTVTDAEAKAIAHFVNVATGRGNMGLKENALVGLNAVFFAPRLVASRFQLLIGEPAWRGSWRTRRLVAAEYGRFLIGLGVVYALARAAGADIEADPRSADFGKIRFGKTRMDPLAGLSQVTVLLSRLGAGETKTEKGKVFPIRGKVPFGHGTAADVIARFLRMKLSPNVGAGVSALAGEDVVRQPVTAASTAQNLLVPMTFNDIYDAMKEQGLARGTAILLLSTFGMSVQTYKAKD